MSREVKANKDVRIKLVKRLRGLRAHPVVVTAKGVVVNGHARVVAAQQSGIAEVPAVVLKHPDIRLVQEVAR